MNEPFWFGDYQYTFTEARQAKELVRNKNVKKKADEGAAFLLVYYTIENLTHEPIRGLDFKTLRVRDKNGRTYNADPFNVFCAGENFTINELAPGLPKKTVAVFQMPLSLILKGTLSRW